MACENSLQEKSRTARPELAPRFFLITRLTLRQKCTPAFFCNARLVKYNGDMQFARLCEYFSQIEATTKRLEKTELLRQLLTESQEREVKQVVYLALGEMRPKYDALDFQLADKMVMKAVAWSRSIDKTIGQVEQDYKTLGDLGVVVEKYLKPNIRYDSNVKSLLTVEAVYNDLEQIAKISGQGSQQGKIQRLGALLQELDGVSAKYIVRIVLGKLRLGFSDKTILDTLSFIDKGDKSAREQLDRLYQIAPDVGELAYQVKKLGIDKAGSAIKIELGRPVIPALAQRLPTADEMIKKMGRVIVEGKYDGVRLQIHYSKNPKSEIMNPKQVQNSNVQNGLFGEEKREGWVKTFTRNLDENSSQFPELATIGDQIKAQEVILDAEAVGYDPKTGKLVPFQTTITRKRKHGVLEAAGSVPLRFFIFDILYKDGQSLIELPLYERRKILRQVVGAGNVLVIDEELVTESADAVRAYHKARLHEGLEGAMVKKYDGAYEPGRQGFNWVKFKEEEGQEGKLIDTIDAVVMGYYKGRGKRAGFGLGAFLIGIRDGVRIVTIAKIGTGLTDEQFTTLYSRLTELETSEIDPTYSVASTLVPDVWVRPELVVEVAADEVTKSPTHSSGYALRFPRLVKFREDKDASDLTTKEEFVIIGGIT